MNKSLLTCDTRPWPLTIIGINTETESPMKRIAEDVTRVRAQFRVNAMMMEATIVALYSKKTPSFSEMPS